MMLRDIEHEYETEFILPDLNVFPDLIGISTTTAAPFHCNVLHNYISD